MTMVTPLLPDEVVAVSVMSGREPVVVVVAVVSRVVAVCEREENVRTMSMEKCWKNVGRMYRGGGGGGGFGSGGITSTFLVFEYEIRRGISLPDGTTCENLQVHPSYVTSDDGRGRRPSASPFFAWGWLMENLFFLS
jgi:hypothetical protein